MQRRRAMPGGRAAVGADLSRSESSPTRRWRRSVSTPRLHRRVLSSTALPLQPRSLRVRWLGFRIAQSALRAAGRGRRHRRWPEQGAGVSRCARQQQRGGAGERLSLLQSAISLLLALPHRAPPSAPVSAPAAVRR